MRHLLLALALVGCSDRERPRDPAQAAGARALERAPDPEPLPETAAAVSPAELAPGQPHDLGDGLLLQVECAGSGPPAHAGSRVTLRYVAKVKDTETVVASTEGWQAPLATVLGAGSAPRLLPALEQALLGLRAGCKARVEVPAARGYGKQSPPGTEDKTLVIELELVEVGE